MTAMSSLCAGATPLSGRQHRFGLSSPRALPQKRPDRRSLLVQGPALLGSALLLQGQSRTMAEAAGVPSVVVTESLAAATSAVSLVLKPLQYETAVNGMQRVVYDKEGWNWWSWQGHKIHYAVDGPEDAPPLVLIHGYGASTYHWRYQMPELAKKYRVYAMCLLGFGWSEKAPAVDYTNGKPWISQISQFIEEVVGKPAALAGNSLGGYASLATASARPDLIRAVALLNGAGPFSEAGKEDADPDVPEPPLSRLSNALAGVVKRVVLFFAFIRAKQPERIKEVLDLVYVHKEMVDAELVDSIVQPALDPNASEVFFKINHRTGAPVTVNRLLSKLQVPLLLLWGMKDPWIVPARAKAVMELFPSAEFVPLPTAGHCPHDDTPQEANLALLKWMESLPAAGKAL